MLVSATMYFKLNNHDGKDYCFSCAVKEIQKNPHSKMISSLETGSEVNCDICKELIPEIEIRI